MLNGKIKTIENCSFHQSEIEFVVLTNNAKYRLDTKGPHPGLSINGKLTSAGRGDHIRSSLSRECDLFIALADPREDFNRSYSNYPKGLCVLQKGK